MNTEEKATASPTGGSLTPLWVLVFGILVLMAGVRWLPVLAANPYDTAKHFMADDAFYYFQIARNIARGAGSTFDGLNVTNGYHPLWLLVAAAAFRLAEADSSSALSAIYALQFLIIVASSFVVFMAFRRDHAFAAAVTATLLLAGTCTTHVLFVGMESGVGLLLMILLFWLFRTEREVFYDLHSLRHALVVVFLLACLALSRLEAWAFVALWMFVALQTAVCAPTEFRRTALIRWVSLAALFGLLLAAYVAVNMAMVQLPLPISGCVKTSTVSTASQMGRIFAEHVNAYCGLFSIPSAAKRFPLMIPFGVALLAGATWMEARGRFSGKRFMMWLPFFGFPLLFMTLGVFSSGGGWSWYGWPMLFLGVLGSFCLVKRALLATGAHGRIAMVGILVAYILIGWASMLRPRGLKDWAPLEGVVMDHAIRFVREQIPAGERIAARSCGILTFFSDREIENEEGLVNGIDFYRARGSPETYRAYMRKHGIRWIAFPAHNREGTSLTLAFFRERLPIDTQHDVNHFYDLDLQASHPELTDPNVYFLRVSP